eukprot:a680744_80.p2 GENE.a680744_80~~a680744_80.p2  ORF type:complete len:108 (+),score=9.92 a680744_80:33-326(+)
MTSVTPSVTPSVAASGKTYYRSLDAALQHCRQSGAFCLELYTDVTPQSLARTLDSLAATPVRHVGICGDTGSFTVLDDAMLRMLSSWAAATPSLVSL